MLKGTFNKSIVKIPSILHYPKQFYEAKYVTWQCHIFYGNVSITKLHIISHNFCIEEDIYFQRWFKQIKYGIKLLNFNFG